MGTEIEEGNKIITKFIGCKIDKKSYGYWWYKIKDGRFGYIHQLKYHSSWDWLHSVIDKIKIVHSGLDANEVRIILFELTVVEDIHTVWLSVLTYIKWYNLYITELVEDFKKHGLP